jgi:hypothetical protein
MMVSMISLAFPLYVRQADSWLKVNRGPKTGHPPYEFPDISTESYHTAQLEALWSREGQEDRWSLAIFFSNF